MAKLIMLNQNKDFRRIYYRGKSVVSPALVVYFTKNRAGFCRLGITVGKKIGGAVERNRAKRVIRQAYGACLADIPENTSYDFVIVARVKAVHVKSYEAEKMLRSALIKAGIIKDENK